MKNIFIIYIFSFLLHLYKQNIISNDKIFINNNKKRKLNPTNTINNFVNIESTNDKVSYITSTISEDGDVYLAINSESSTTTERLIYKINLNFTQESKILTINSPILNIYPSITVLKLIGKTYLCSVNILEKRFEILNYNNSKTYYKSCSSINSNIYKNTFSSLKYYNYEEYVINAFINKNSKLIIQKLYFEHPEINVRDITYSEKQLGNGLLNSSVTCFEFENYLECLYTNSNLLYTVSIFDIQNLDNIYNEIIETKAFDSQNIFNKCIHIKNRVGAFFYFLDDSQKIKLQIKNFEINEDTYILKDYIENISIININDHGILPLKNNYIYNDVVKTDENNIFYISTGTDEIELYLVLIKLLNNDNNILLNYYRIKIYEQYKLIIYKDINLFALNGFLGVAMTHYDYDLDSDKTFSSFFIFGNISWSENIYTNFSGNIFSQDNFEIKISEITDKINFYNNIFGYIVTGIRIISILNETEIGFYIYSNEKENKIESNEIISKTDIISFKPISEIGVKLDNYSIKYEIIIKEPDFENFISYAYPVEYYPYNDSISDEEYVEMYKSLFEPKILARGILYFNFSVNECNNKCETCFYYGDDINNHCDICLNNYSFSSSIINGNNCYEYCPQNYITVGYRCIKISEERNTEMSSETNTNIKCIEEISNEGISNIINSEEYSLGKNSEEISNENKSKEEEEKNVKSNIENNCKKYFYIDENSKINCINGNICIDEYPHLDKNIENLCTNCIFKYNNKCYMDCPENTCIKQDKNLDTCIDIKGNTKVINKICFENFQDLASNIKEMSENNIIIQNIPNLTIYAYNIEKNISYFEEKQITYIYFNDIQDILIKEFNLNENEKIYALIVDSPSKYSNSSINDYGFVLLLENGTELDLSNINEDIRVRISIPIINLDLAKFNYATMFSDQGYDIYDKNNRFYHDICTPGYLNDDDLTLEDRKKEIYTNNITTGKSNCEYQLTDLNSQRFIYNCSLIDINENNTNNNDVFSFEEEDKNENVLNYILDVVNYKVLNCSFLFVNLDNFRHNKAVMICTTSIFISILLLIIFFTCRISKIRINMFKEMPNVEKIKKLIKEKKENSYKSSNNLLNPTKKRKSNKFDKINNNFEISQINRGDSINTFNRINLSQEKKHHTERIKKINNSLNKTQRNKNKNSSNKNIQINNQKINILEDDDIPLKTAIKIDDRSVFFIFRIKITEKIKILDIIINKKIKETLLSEYFLYLLIDLTMNALLYSDNIVSHKRHNGRIDTILVISLSAFANILASMIGYYLQLLIGFEEKINQIKEIKYEKEFLRVFNIILREVKIRVIIFFICEVCLIICCTYYLFIFFTIYHKSQMSLLKSYLISLLENWLINLVIVILIVAFRKLGIKLRNKYVYNTSKYLDKNF